MSYLEQEQDLQFQLLQPAQAQLDKQRVITPGVLTTQFALNLGLGVLAFALAYLARYTIFETNPDGLELAPVSFEQYMGLGLIFGLSLSTLLSFRSHAIGADRRRDLLLNCNTVLISTALVSLGTALVMPGLLYSRLVFVYLVPLAIGWLQIKNFGLRQARLRDWLPGQQTRNLIMVGATDTGVQLMRAAAENNALGYNLLGFVDDQLRYADWTLPVRYGNSVKRGNKEVPHLGKSQELVRLLEGQAVDEVIISLPVDQHHLINQVMEQCRERGIAARFIPDAPGVVMSSSEVNRIMLDGSLYPTLDKATYGLKRLVDIGGVLAGLLILAIPMSVIALLIRLDSKGPVLFRQTRVGKGGKYFTFFKFRSMYTDAEARLAEIAKYNETAGGVTFKMKNDPRVTRVGRFIRRTSLDELPQLFNILLGQMSLVGPRPGLPREIMLYRPWQLRRLEVTPGLTGLWQVNGRSLTTFDEMVKLDVYYLEHWSLWLDLQILVKTVQEIFKGEGAF